jgi:hypothetical protein
VSRPSRRTRPSPKGSAPRGGRTVYRRMAKRFYAKKQRRKGRQKGAVDRDEHHQTIERIRRQKSGGQKMKNGFDHERPGAAIGRNQNRIKPRITRIRADNDERGEWPIRAYPRNPRSFFMIPPDSHSSRRANKRTVGCTNRETSYSCDSCHSWLCPVFVWPSFFSSQFFC